MKFKVGDWVEIVGLDRGYCETNLVWIRNGHRGVITKINVLCPTQRMYRDLPWYHLIIEGVEVAAYEGVLRLIPPDENRLPGTWDTCVFRPKIGVTDAA